MAPHHPYLGLYFVSTSVTNRQLIFGTVLPLSTPSAPPELGILEHQNGCQIQSILRPLGRARTLLFRYIDAEICISPK